ncbi:hypothetical protein J1N35_014516 [Gossypium stocksii]|uniref:Aminotransferase-like plant mobile domain-containing protein n=1 Tax=Gossypium stocksii TaxID=47602 RepID=A0A9D4A904_9ROSI|nr:hypothetical protein J1N35_014516 [Gossypium stocksii]
MQLQLGLPVDGYTVTESTQSANWGTLCYELLGAIRDNINGGRIEMDLKYNCMLKIYLIRWNHSAGYVGIPTALEDIQLLLDQQSEAQFQWTPYEDPTSQAVILNEFFQNLNIWHVKVLLVNYATVEMHQSDRVLQQFKFRQSIPVASEVLDSVHKIDLRQLNTDWPRFWSEYIEVWENRYANIPIREPIIVLELVCVSEYMPWFRIHGNLLSEEER